MEPPHKTETKSSLPGGLLSSDVEVPLSNLIKEEVMEMIDPEDPQPLLDTEIKSNNLNTTHEQKHASCKVYETVIVVLCLLFGCARFYLPEFHHERFEELDLEYLYNNTIYTKITATAVFLMIVWELFVLMNIWYQQFISTLLQNIFQIIVLIILCIGFGIVKDDYENTGCIVSLFFYMYIVVAIFQLIYVTICIWGLDCLEKTMHPYEY